MAREEAGKATVARCSGSARPFICLAKWPERRCRWGADGLRAAPLSHTHTRPVTWSSSPEWAAGVPLLLPATAPPRWARARSLLGHQKIHRVLMHGKETLPVSLRCPHAPAPPKQVTLSFLKRRPPEEPAGDKNTMDGVQVGGPL